MTALGAGVPRRIAIALGVALGSVATCGARPAAAQDREQCVAAFDDGQLQQRRDALRAARASFLTCAADACPAMLRKDCAQSLSEIDEEIPTIVFGARDTAGNDLIPSAVYVDGARVTALDGGAVPADPGPHDVRFEHAPDAPVVEHVVLRIGEHNRTIVATFAARHASPGPAPPAAMPAARDAVGGGRPSTSTWVAAGIGALGLASFAYFGISGYVEKRSLLGSCAPDCKDSDVARVRFDYIAGDVSLGVGVLALGVATYLFFSTRAPSSGAISVAPSKDGVVVGWRDRF